MKTLRDAAIAGATIALLLYVAMTAAKSMADVLQPSVEISAGTVCKPGLAKGSESCKDVVQLAQGGN